MKRIIISIISLYLVLSISAINYKGELKTIVSTPEPLPISIQNMDLQWIDAQSCNITGIWEDLNNVMIADEIEGKQLLSKQGRFGEITSQGMLQYFMFSEGYIKGDSLVLIVDYYLDMLNGDAPYLTMTLEFRGEKDETETSLNNSTTNTFSLSIQPKQITVSGTGETVSIYSITGQRVAQSTGAGSYGVPAAGVYIVRVGSEVRKVIVH